MADDAKLVKKFHYEEKREEDVDDVAVIREIPKGKPECLKGLQFVITGVLISIKQKEAADLIKSCGGNVVGGLSKKVTCLLVGLNARPAKVARATDMGMKLITEDELFSIFRKNSALTEVQPLLDSQEGQKSEIKTERKKIEYMKVKEVEPFICGICQKEFIRIGFRDRHIRMNHNLFIFSMKLLK